MDKANGCRRMAYSLFFAAIFLGGCAGTRLYRASEDASAQKAKNAIVAADLKNALAPERIALQEFKKREQEAVRRDQIGIRDLKLIALLSATDKEHGWDFLQTEIEKRYDELINGTSKEGVEIQTKVGLVEVAQSTLDPHIRTYLMASEGKVKLQCRDPLPESQRPPDRTDLAFTYYPFVDACKAYIEAGKNLDALQQKGGMLQVVATKIKEIERDQALFEENLFIAKKVYADALSASKAAKPEDGKIEGLAASLKKSFDGLATTSEFNALANDKILSRLLDEGKLEQVKKKKAAIDEVIQALQGNVDAEAKPALKRLSAISGLEKVLTAEPAPPVSALILQAEFLRLEASGIEKHVTRAKEKIALYMKKRATILDEIIFLNEATKAFDAFQALKTLKNKKECPEKTTIHENFLSATKECRLHLAQGLSGFVNAMTFGKTEQELIDYQMIELGHDAALDDSETALVQTDNLIRVPLEQLAKIYSDGFKPEDLSNVIHALGLSAIAVRVK